MMKDGNTITGTDVLAIMNDHSACVTRKFYIRHTFFHTCHA